MWERIEYHMKLFYPQKTFTQVSSNVKWQENICKHVELCPHDVFQKSECRFVMLRLRGQICENTEADSRSCSSPGIIDTNLKIVWVNDGLQKICVEILPQMKFSHLSQISPICLFWRGGNIQTNENLDVHKVVQTFVMQVFRCYSTDSHSSFETYLVLLK